MQEFAERFYKSKAWHDCRKSFIAKRLGLCEVCLAKGIYKPGEIVHHKIVLSPQNINQPEVTLNHENLMLVCRDCHADQHKPKKRYKVDELGRVIPWDD